MTAQGPEFGPAFRRALGSSHGRRVLVPQLLTLFTTPVVHIYVDRLSGWLSPQSRAQFSGGPAKTGARERS